jgi:hypothetical protein
MNFFITLWDVINPNFFIDYVKISDTWKCCHDPCVKHAWAMLEPSLAHLIDLFLVYPVALFVIVCTQFISLWDPQGFPLTPQTVYCRGNGLSDLCMMKIVPFDMVMCMKLLSYSNLLHALQLSLVADFIKCGMLFNSQLSPGFVILDKNKKLRMSSPVMPNHCHLWHASKPSSCKPGLGLPQSH